MKKIFRLSAYIVMALVLSISFFASACADRDTHTCGNICSVCGLCTDSDCTDPVCADKCAGHGPHECEQQCTVCGGCLDMACDDEVCAEKCGSDHSNSQVFSVTDLMVAKTNVTVDTSGYVYDFTLTNNGAISYNFNAASAGTVTMSVFLRRTVSSAVYTDYVTITVNGQPFTSPAKVPALSSTATSLWTEVNLGCVDFVQGTNEILLVANGDGAYSWMFQSIKLYYDMSITLAQAEETVAHACDSACETCGGCTNFSCYNPGCAGKCTCVSETGAAATLFWALDERVYTNRNVNSELDGIGCTWNSTTIIEYYINADKTGIVEFGMVISVDIFEILVTDQFVTTVNGNPVTANQAGWCPVGEARDWNDYHLVVAGYFEVVKGLNVIHIEQRPVRVENGGNGGAYNFQGLVIFSDEITTSWVEHGDYCEYCDGCLDEDCVSLNCSEKCEGHVNEDVPYAGYDVVVDSDSNYKLQPQTFYNFDKITVIEGQELLIDDDDGKAFNGEALAPGNIIIIRFYVQDVATIALRPFMTPVVIPETEDEYSIDGLFKFRVDGYEVNEYRLRYATNGGWTRGTQYVNVGTTYYNFMPGMHTLEIEILGGDIPHINEVRINVQSYGSWLSDGIHLCSQVCSDCGGCKDAACTDSVCETKCSCAQGLSLGAVMQSYANLEDMEYVMAYSTYRYRVI